jgi:hypothetical protein
MWSSARRLSSAVPHTTSCAIDVFVPPLHQWTTVIVTLRGGSPSSSWTLDSWSLRASALRVDTPTGPADRSPPVVVTRHAQTQRSSHARRQSEHTYVACRPLIENPLSPSL